MSILGFFTKLARRPAEAAAVPAAPSIHPTLVRATQPGRINLRCGMVAAATYPICFVHPTPADDPFVAHQLRRFATHCGRHHADLLSPIEGALHRLARAPRFLSRRLLVISTSGLPADDKRLVRIGHAAREANVTLDLVLIGEHRNLGYLAPVGADTLTVARTAPEADAAIRQAVPDAAEQAALTVVLESSAAMRTTLGGRSRAAIVADALLHSLARPADAAASSALPQLQAA